LSKKKKKPFNFSVSGKLLKLFFHVYDYIIFFLMQLLNIFTLSIFFIRRTIKEEGFRNETRFADGVGS